jgi:hypothetical protein
MRRRALPPALLLTRRLVARDRRLGSDACPRSSAAAPLAGLHRFATWRVAAGQGARGEGQTDSQSAGRRRKSWSVQVPSALARTTRAVPLPGSGVLFGSELSLCLGRRLRSERRVTGSARAWHRRRSGRAGSAQSQPESTRPGPLPASARPRRGMGDVVIARVETADEKRDRCRAWERARRALLHARHQGATATPRARAGLGLGESREL